jgi:hypothetical protein
VTTGVIWGYEGIGLQVGRATKRQHGPHVCIELSEPIERTVVLSEVRIQISNGITAITLVHDSSRGPRPRPPPLPRQ